MDVSREKSGESGDTEVFASHHSPSLVPWTLTGMQRRALQCSGADVSRVFHQPDVQSLEPYLVFFSEAQQKSAPWRYGLRSKISS